MKFRLMSCAVGAVGLLVITGSFQVANARLSQDFLIRLQKQYERGYIPDPAKSMSYEEKLAIRKKQQKLAEEQRKKKALQPPPPPYRTREERYRKRQYDESYQGDPYEQTYRYCRSMWSPGSREFSRCMRRNREMIREERYNDDYYYNRGRRY